MIKYDTSQLHEKQYLKQATLWKPAIQERIKGMHCKQQHNKADTYIVFSPSGNYDVTWQVRACCAHFYERVQAALGPMGKRS